MLYKMKNKNITIPEKEIEKFKTKYSLSEQEAIQLWLEDNDYAENEVVAELSAKAKHIRHYEQSDKPRKPSTRERKVDTIKAHLLQILINSLKNDYSITAIKNEAEFAFSNGKDNYTVKLIKHRPK